MKYISFFSTESDQDLCLSTSPAGINKSTYVAQLLHETGHSVEIISPAWSKCGRWKYWKAFDKTLDDEIVVHQLATFGTPVRWLVPLQWIHSLGQLFFYLTLHTKKDEPVLVYHSYYLSIPIRLAKKFKKFKLVLEVEEIYQDIVSMPQIIQQQESKILEEGDRYIFSTAAIRKRIHQDMPFIVINGSYRYAKTSARMSMLCDEKIHCLYSGTFDPSKAGAYLAVEAAIFLPKQYCIHISGFGTQEQTKALQEKIRQVRRKAACDIIYEGFLDDATYEKLLCKCQIGLNTQTPDQRFSDTCFPSKILVYMSHGLQVVSAANEAITMSDVGDYLTYYHSQTPEAVARAIRSVTPEHGANNIKIIEKLHANMQTRIQNLLSQM